MPSHSVCPASADLVVLVTFQGSARVNLWSVLVRDARQPPTVDESRLREFVGTET